MNLAKLVPWPIPLVLALTFVICGPLTAMAAQTRTPRLVSSPVASPATSPVAAPPIDRDVTFTSSADTIYGSLMMPANATGKLPAVVIIAGSGPTATATTRSSCRGSGR